MVGGNLSLSFVTQMTKNTLQLYNIISYQKPIILKHSDSQYTKLFQTSFEANLLASHLDHATRISGSLIIILIFLLLFLFNDHVWSENTDKYTHSRLGYN